MEESIRRKPLVRDRRLLNFNTTNINDFNNLKYPWVSDWYRNAMNNFWVPEEISLNPDKSDYPNLLPAERTAYDKILSFLVYLDSLQSANLPNISQYVTANEINLCLSIQTFQECIHSQSYSYMLDTICSPLERDQILYQWKEDEHLLKRNTFIGNLYNEFVAHQDKRSFLRVCVASISIPGSCSSTISAEMERCLVPCRKSAISTGMRTRICGCSWRSSISCRRKNRNSSPRRISR